CVSSSQLNPAIASHHVVCVISCPIITIKQRKRIGFSVSIVLTNTAFESCFRNESINVLQFRTLKITVNTPHLCFVNDTFSRQTKHDLLLASLS
ncbi:hypothetical protein L9F63_025596, partial [Diploptera punctata]